MLTMITIIGFNPYSPGFSIYFKNNLDTIDTKEDIRNVFENNFYDYNFQWELLDKFLETIE